MNGIIIKNELLKQVGIVVPTLGTRVEYLFECLKSIKNSGCQTIYLVGPKESLQLIDDLSGLYTLIIEDQGAGLTSAINNAIFSLPENIKYVGWIGDDDLLTESSLFNSILIFENQINVVATYGSCTYVDALGNNIYTNNSGKWAVKFMNFLPNLIPQPGSLFLRTAYEQVGGVKPTYPLSFDFELFFNLRKLGKVVFVPKVQGKFRWHQNSLSVAQRRQAVLQTSQIRKSFLPKILKPFAFLWEPVIIVATIFIGEILNKKMKYNK